MVVGCLCRYTCWKHMLSMPMRGRLVLFIRKKKKRLSNVQHFRLPVLRCEGLFICGTLFLLIIAQESQSVTPSLSVSHKFFKRHLPNTRHLAGWLQSRNQRRSLCVSVFLFFNHPFSCSSHVQAYAFGEIFLYRQIIKTQSLLESRCGQVGTWRYWGHVNCLYVWD